MSKVSTCYVRTCTYIYACTYVRTYVHTRCLSQCKWTTCGVIQWPHKANNCMYIHVYITMHLLITLYRTYVKLYYALHNHKCYYAADTYVRMYESNKWVQWCVSRMEEDSRVWLIHAYLERLCPWGAWAGTVWVKGDWVHLLLEQQQHTVHDPHDEVGRLCQLPHCGNVGCFDGLHACKWRRAQTPQQRSLTTMLTFIMPCVSKPCHMALQ